jgi:AraC-like DNA-binding protein
MLSDDHKVFHSSDLEFVREAVARVFRPHNLELVDPEAELNAQMHSARLRNVAVCCVSYGAEVRVNVGELESFYIVQTPLTGKAWVRYGVDRFSLLPGSGSVNSPTNSLAMHTSSDCATLIIRIERSALEAHVRDLLRQSLQEPIEFSPRMNFTHGPTCAWYESVLFAIKQLNCPEGLLNYPLAVVNIEEMLMTALMMTQPNNYSDALAGDTQAGMPRNLKSALDLIESHPEWEHSVGSIARELNVTVRALQKIFRHHLDTSPSAYLRRVRLERAHDELHAADHGTATVAEVAQRWGFFHLGRFSSIYRTHFGEAPSDTLRS